MMDFGRGRKESNTRTLARELVTFIAEFDEPDTFQYIDENLFLQVDACDQPIDLTSLLIGKLFQFVSFFHER